METKFSPTGLDIAAFARTLGELSGRLTLPVDEGVLKSRFARLWAEAFDNSGVHELNWLARGEQRVGAQGQAQAWLFLEAQTVLPMQCQRCLGSVEADVATQRWFRFVEDEAAAAAEDDAAEEDVLVLAARFDLLALVEDELLMALPMVPKHATCPVQVVTSAGEAEFESVLEDKPHPFAALNAIKPRNAK